ncbi:hypothetical protein [Prochlorococcus marinus]|uniref:hypothetical protein n=1 Tax=Prochlorococcus marinus TaxID=1219 RepID=UPI0022B563CA|nr:hypothetical protein [Prochlorococcus marinus]
MRNSLIAKSIVFLALYPLIINSASSKNIDNQLFINQLEESLNQRKDNLLKELFLQKSFNQFKKHYLTFRKKYKDAKWSIKPVKNDQNKSLLDVKIISTREINDQIYNLYTKQTVKIDTYKNKIKEYEVIDEESILNSQKSPLIIKIISPDKVLTGEKYEMNLIIEKPLDNSLTASGIIVLKNEDNKNISNDVFGIKPNQSGGLFKFIQAPLKPGSQTISAIITHPEGIYLITKKIKVD